jgi:mono/diheme cytochrome c family protein
MRIEMMKAAAAVSLLLLFGIPHGLWVPATAPSSVAASPQSSSKISIWSGVFTAEQAKRGEELYQARCADCHGEKLVSASDAPTLAAPAFKFAWHQKTIAERFEVIRTTMPPGGSGTLSDQEYLDIVAYILQFNAYPSGNQELKPDKEMLDKIVIEPAPGGK